MGDRSIADLSIAIQPLAQQFLDRCNAHPVFIAAHASVFITETFRSEEDQNADYAKGRTAPGPIVTKAKWGQSPHNCTLPDGTPAAQAFDFAIKTADGSLDWNPKDTLWKTAISIGIALGLVSGSGFKCGLKDNPHFEMPNWKLV